MTVPRPRSRNTVRAGGASYASPTLNVSRNVGLVVTRPSSGLLLIVGWGRALLRGEQGDDRLLVEVPFAEGAGEDGILKIFEPLDVQGGVDIVFELFVEIAFGIGSPAFEAADVFVEHAGGDQPGILVVFEVDDFDEALVDLPAAAFRIVFGGEHGFADVDDALLEFGDDVVVVDHAGGFGAEVAAGAFEGAARAFDDFLFELLEEFAATFENEFLLRLRKLMGLVVESHEGGIGGGVEELLESFTQFLGVDLVRELEVFGGGAEVEFHVDGEKGEESAVDPANFLHLLIEALPVGLQDILAVEFAHVIEGIFDAEGANVGLEPAQELDVARGERGSGRGRAQFDFLERQAVARVPGGFGADEGLDHPVGQGADQVGHLAIGRQHGFGAVVEHPDVAEGAGVIVGGEQHLLAAGSVIVEVAPLNGGAVVGQGGIRSVDLVADEDGGGKNGVIHDGRAGDHFGGELGWGVGEVTTEPVIERLGVDRGVEAAGEVVSEPEDVADLVGGDLADIILGGAEHGGVGQAVGGEHRFHAGDEFRGELVMIDLADRRGRKQFMAVRCRSCGIALRVSGGFRGGGFRDLAHGPEQGAGAGFAADGEDAGDKGLAVAGGAGAGIDQEIGVGEARVVPGDPLDDVVTGIGRGHAFGCRLGLDQVAAKSAVPIEDPFPHGFHIIVGCVGGVIEDDGLADVEPRDPAGGAAGDGFEPGLSLEEAEIPAVTDRHFLGHEIRGRIGSQEIAHLVTFLAVGIDLAIAQLGALANHEAVALFADLEDPALGQLHRAGEGGGVEVSARGIPDLGKHAAHPRPEIDHHFIAILVDNGKRGQEPAGGQIVGDHQAIGGFIEIDAVREKFEPNDFSGQAGAGGGAVLRDHRAGKEEIALEGGAMDRNVVIGCGAQRLDGRVVLDLGLDDWEKHEPR